MVKKFTQWRILYPYLSDYQRSMILADFEKELERPHQTLKRYVEDLVESKVLRKEERKRHSSYRLNLENLHTFEFISISEKLRTYELLEENKLLNRLYEKISPHFLKAYFCLFGSYAAERKGNDIDLLIIGDVDEKLEDDLREFEDTYKEVHRVSVGGKDELDRKFKKELIKKHIILNGSDYFVRLFGDMYVKFGMV